MSTRKDLAGLPDGGLGSRTNTERLVDLKSLCAIQGQFLRRLLFLAWRKTHPGGALHGGSKTTMSHFQRRHTCQP